MISFNKCKFNYCKTDVALLIVFLNNSSKAHAHYLANLKILRKFISLRAFAVSIKNSLRFEISEICTEVSFTPPEVMWTLMMKLPHTKVKFYPKVKSQTGLSSLRVSCKRALSMLLFAFISASGNFNDLFVFNMRTNFNMYKFPVLHI